MGEISGNSSRLGAGKKRGAMATSILTQKHNSSYMYKAVGTVRKIIRKQKCLTLSTYLLLAVNSLFLFSSSSLFHSLFTWYILFNGKYCMFCSLSLDYWIVTKISMWYYACIFTISLNYLLIDPLLQARSQALPSPERKTLVWSGHVAPRFWVVTNKINVADVPRIDLCSYLA